MTATARAMALFVGAACCLLPIGCAGLAAGIGGAGGAVRGMSVPSAPTSPGIPAASTPLLLFGGEGHRTFLGCLNCSEYASDSVMNKYGQHGSAYATDSIFNRYGTFGSAYSASSPCNPYASDPPVIVDASGSFYGRLTINAYAPERTRIAYAEWLVGNLRGGGPRPLSHPLPGGRLSRKVCWLCWCEGDLSPVSADKRYAAFASNRRVSVNRVRMPRRRY
jgi:hypothetical protein